MLIIKIALSYTFPTCLGLKTKDEPRMKKCLGWHFECCARRVPTLRKSAAHRIKKRTPKLEKSTFLKLAVFFPSLIPYLILPTDDRENSEGTPRELPVTKKCCLLSEGVRRNALRVKHPKSPHSEEIAQYIEWRTPRGCAAVWL